VIHLLHTEGPRPLEAADVVVRSRAVRKLRPAPLSFPLAVVSVLLVLSSLPVVRILGARDPLWLPITEPMVVSLEPPPCLKCLRIESLFEALDPLRTWVEVGDDGA
jgi:hypothetical protein